MQLAIMRLRANTCEDSTGTYPPPKVFLPLNNMWLWNFRNPEDVSLSLSVRDFSVRDLDALLEHPQDLQFFSLIMCCVGKRVLLVCVESALRFPLVLV